MEPCCYWMRPTLSAPGPAATAVPADYSLTCWSWANRLQEALPARFMASVQKPLHAPQRPNAILNPELEQTIHLYLLNQGLIITPFHNMMLVCPDTTQADVDRLVGTLENFIVETRSAP